jgi:hypothetical protein
MAKKSEKSTSPTEIFKPVNPKQSRRERDGQEQIGKIETGASIPHAVQPVGVIQPRIIRLKDAPRYLGMNRNLFNKEVRPGLVTVPIGQQGIGFDRLDLDAWVDAYKQCNGRPRDLQGENQWAIETRQDSANVGTSGTSKKRSKVYDFSKALAKVTGKKPKHTSSKG